ncbi:MAG: hypothetical protein RIG77_16515 [Cyclobacteriaceae bacterium]
MKVVFLFLLSLLVYSAGAQDYSLTIRQAEVNFGSVKHSAYQSRVALPYETVKKEWWRYIKRKAVIRNQGTHHENTILPKRGQAEAKVVFYSLIENEGTYPKVSLALNKEGIPEAQLKEYNQYLQDILQDFKIQLYASHIQEQIDVQEKKARKTSRKIEKLTRINEKLISSKGRKNTSSSEVDRKVQLNEQEIEKYRVELFAYQQKLEDMKGNLTRIK